MDCWCAVVLAHPWRLQTVLTTWLFINTSHIELRRIHGHRNTTGGAEEKEPWKKEVTSESFGQLVGVSMAKLSRHLGGTLDIDIPSRDSQTSGDQHLTFLELSDVLRLQFVEEGRSLHACLFGQVSGLVKTKRSNCDRFLLRKGHQENTFCR